MIRAIVIDDEQKLRDVLIIKLEQYCPQVNVIGQANSASKGYELITERRPDLIFLDIAMPEESGFDMLGRFGSIDFEIIFVTGFNEYALDALKVSAVDYILKPVHTPALMTAVNKAEKRIEDRSKIAKYDVLKYNLNRIGDQSAKIAIPGSSAYEFVKIQQIIRCEGWQKYTKIHLDDGNVIVSSYNLGVFRDMLESYDFYSTHKSHLINKLHIKRYHKEGSIIMSDDSNVPVARRRKEDFFDQVIRYLG